MNGEQLRDWRKRMGLTQTDLAKQWQCSVRAVQHYEGGTRAVPERFAKLCKTAERRRRQTTGEIDDIAIPDRLARWIKRCFLPTFDLAASAENALTPRYFTREQNALAHSWLTLGRAYGNVPFSLKEQFCCKAWEETQKSKGALMVILLLPSGPGSGDEWFRNVVWLADRIILLPRIRFKGQKNVAKFEVCLSLYGALAYEKRHGIGKKFHLWDQPYLETKYWMSGREQNASDYARRLLAADEYRLRVHAERGSRKS